MKHLFNFLSFAAIAVMTMVSCNKEIETPDYGADPACPEGYYVEELTAVYPHDPETRTAFNETTGRFAWTEGDELAFHLSNGEYVAAPIDPATGKVKLYLPVGVTRDNYAVYPAASIVDDAAEIGNMKVTLPNTYDISENPTTDYVPTPLVAWNDAENNHLKFEHVGGLLQVNLTVPAGVKTAKLNMGKVITGTFSLEDGTGNGIIAPGEATTEDGITFILSEEGLTEETEVKLLAPLPTGTYEHFEVVYDNGFEFSRDLDATPWVFSRSGGKKVSIGEDKFEAPDYFWFEALEAGSTVSFGSVSRAGYEHLRNLYYSFDRTNWTRITGPDDIITLENEGDRVWFYSDGDTPLGRRYGNSNDFVYVGEGRNFKGTGKLKCGGELAYLWKKGEAEMVEKNYLGLFSAMTALYDATEIIYPEGIAPYCYYGMFYGCTNLEQVPAILPEMTLDKACYQRMFYNCSSLKTVLTLPAETLAESCYDSMFWGSGIEEAPIMQFKHTAPYSCRWMFRDADQLVTAPVFHNEDLTNNCFDSMFMGCDGLVYGPELPPITELAEYCYSYMFQCCPNMVSGPSSLPATALVKRCYEEMFYGNYSLASMPEMPSSLDPVPDYAMTAMFANCKALTEVVVPEMDNLGKESLGSLFAGCTSLTKADVKTTHFYDGEKTYYGSHHDMFNGCTSLSEITVYFTSWSYMRTNQWVSNVSPTGVFIKPAELPEVYSTTQIPAGWEVRNLGE